MKPGLPPRQERQDTRKQNGVVANGVPGSIAHDKTAGPTHAPVANGALSPGKGKAPADEIIGTGKFIYRVH